MKPAIALCASFVQTTPLNLLRSVLKLSTSMNSCKTQCSVDQTIPLSFLPIYRARREHEFHCSLRANECGQCLHVTAISGTTSYFQDAEASSGPETIPFIPTDLALAS